MKIFIQEPCGRPFDLKSQYPTFIRIAIAKIERKRTPWYENVLRIINNYLRKLEIQYKMYTIFINRAAIMLFENKGRGSCARDNDRHTIFQRTHFEKVRLPREH